MKLSSICIPSIETYITKDQIQRTFQKINIGELSDIQIRHRKKFHSAFIYIKKWNFSSPYVIELYKKLADGEEVNLIYNFPWFWKCRANHDLKELKYNKLENQTAQYRKKINYLKKENWNLKSYARWLTIRTRKLSDSGSLCTKN